MFRNGGLALTGALILFAGFFANVTLGAFGDGSVLGDVPEMLTLFASAVLFVIGVLAREADANGGPTQD